MMNKRTKDLLAQCTDNQMVMTHQVDLDKFAELIVRECASIAADADLEDVDGGDGDVLRAAASQIRNHFGVE